MPWNFKRSVLTLLKSPLFVILSLGPIRRRIIFEISRRHYEDLGVVVPLPGGVQCPVVSRQHWVSYHHIFCEHEYDALLSHIPLPEVWLDLGCHAGHFTLLLASHWAQQTPPAKWRALLVDGDSRSQPAIEKIISYNRFAAEQIVFLHGAICREGEEIQFEESANMSSGVASSNSKRSRCRRVASISERDIISHLQPPYDLIKLDIEGGEFDFLAAYREVLSQTKYLIFEWHSWHRGGGGQSQLTAMAEQTGFRFVAECHSDRVIQRHGKSAKGGLVLMERKA